MRWSYKTVHYELKKEGILGSTFLDESEVELSLNEYGKSGWELVSMLETMDGLIAVFKQPLSLDSGFQPQSVKKNKGEPAPPKAHSVTMEPAVDRFTGDDFPDGGDDPMLVEEFDVIEEEEKTEKRTLKDADIGSIVIE